MLSDLIWNLFLLKYVFVLELSALFFRMRCGKKNAKKFSSFVTKQSLLLSKQSWQNFRYGYFFKELLQWD